MDKPIPAFYACYLLRSTVRHSSLYVGSTPNPKRRLGQHNGESKGGAAKTSRDSLRPWEMTCLVSGFSSKVAALQFEWAWQNTHLTRHISPSSRLAQSKLTTRYSPKTGRARKRATRSRLSLTDRLCDLQQLLLATSFKRWPLRLTFYAEDVFRVWQKCATPDLPALHPNLEITIDESSKASAHDAGNTTVSIKGIHAIDVGYTGLRSHLEKSMALLATSPKCTICHSSLPSDGAVTLVCPTSACNGVGHLQCFASAFLRADQESIVPVAGHCSRCGARLQWIDLVKELGLRMRGPNEIKKVLKIRKPRKAKVGEQSASIPPEVENDLSEDEDMDDDLPEDHWHHISDFSDTDMEETGHRSNLGQSFKFHGRAPTPIVDESDWDDAGIVT